jgi:hypothetical protein
MWRLSGAGGDTAAGLREVLGSGLRGYLALFSVVGLAAVPIRAGTPLSSARLALAILGILLNPFCGDLLKPFVQSMTWRIFWAIPFSVILGLFTASLGVALRSTNRRWLGTAAAAAMCGAFALVPGTWTVAAADGTRIAFPGYKVDGSYGVADAAIHVTEPGGLILAPESVAVWIPTFSHPPRAVAVRRMYLDRLPAAEKSNRLRLFDLVEGAQLDDDQVASALREVVDRRVTTVVVSSTSMSMNAIRATLGSYGYSERVVDGHRVFVEIQP